MIHKVGKKNYVLVTSDTGKLRIKGDKNIYSQATEFNDKPQQYEEIYDSQN